MSKLAVIGAGSWGTGLAIALAPRFHTLSLWARTSVQASQIEQSRENGRYLPGLTLPNHLHVTANLEAALDSAEIVLSAVPSEFTRDLYSRMLPFLEAGMTLVSATKGLENGTLLRMSEVIQQTVAARFTPQVAVLSGPTFAKEIAKGDPAAVVIAAQDLNTAEKIQQAFSTPRLRFYTSNDVIGVEIGAALKNVIAIAAGICYGLGLGSNSIAALVTRGLAEITRLAIVLGGNPRTLAGLAGLGDLVLTTTGDLSRNRHVGVELGKGRQLDEILKEMGMVAEGVGTCRAAQALGRQVDVEMPITEKMFEILYESKEPQTAIRELMERPLTTE